MADSLVVKISQTDFEVLMAEYSFKPVVGEVITATIGGCFMRITVKEFGYRSVDLQVETPQIHGPESAALAVTFFVNRGLIAIPVTGDQAGVPERFSFRIDYKDGVKTVYNVTNSVDMYGAVAMLSDYNIRVIKLALADAALEYPVDIRADFKITDEGVTSELSLRPYIEN